jgi:1-acyl-sn-glycerol-3-phosphate acyltransferase
VARAARKSIEAAHERLRAGDALLVFAEGTRSRSNGMQQLLTGVTRYLELPDTRILPVGLIGSEALFPIGDETVHSVQVVGRVGPPILASELEAQSDGDRRVMMDAVGKAIAALLPQEYRGVYE